MSRRGLQEIECSAEIGGLPGTATRRREADALRPMTSPWVKAWGWPLVVMGGPTPPSAQGRSGTRPRLGAGGGGSDFLSWALKCRGIGAFLRV